MKNREHQLSRLKYQLAEKKNRKIRFVFWRLHKEQLRYISEDLHYEVTPFLYRVQTKKLTFYRENTSHLLKTLHHNNKRGKKDVVMKLSVSDKRLLDQYHIKYWVEKYQVKLF